MKPRTILIALAITAFIILIANAISNSSDLLTTNLPESTTLGLLITRTVTFIMTLPVLIMLYWLVFFGMKTMPDPITNDHLVVNAVNSISLLIVFVIVMAIVVTVDIIRRRK